MDGVIERARELVLKEKWVSKQPLDAGQQKGIGLGRKSRGAKKDIVLLGAMLVDIKLRECINEGKIGEHVQRSAAATEEFLSQFGPGEEVKKKVLACVNEHHGDKGFSCIESEVCCNADCCKFLHPFGLFAYVHFLGKRGESFESALSMAGKIWVESGMRFPLIFAERNWSLIALNSRNCLQRRRKRLDFRAKMYCAFALSLTFLAFLLASPAGEHIADAKQLCFWLSGKIKGGLLTRLPSQ